MSKRQERPICRRCKLQMKIVRVEPGRDDESSICRRVGRGCEPTVVIDPLV